MLDLQPLPSDFFARPVVEVAKDLIGTSLVRARPEGMQTAIITEVEAYDGPLDKASHVRFGETPRTKLMYGPAGFYYVYLCYGTHWLLNIVTGEEGYPAAVLIRGAGEWKGPGKLTKALDINGGFNGKPVQRETGLWVAKSANLIDSSLIQKGPRIGIDYAEEWKDAPYRFYI